MADQQNGGNAPKPGSAETAEWVGEGGNDLPPDADDDDVADAGGESDSGPGEQPDSNKKDQ